MSGKEWEHIGGKRKVKKDDIRHTINHFTGTNIRRVNNMTFSELELVIDTIIDYINYAYILNHNDYKCLARLLLKELDDTQKKPISDKLDSVYSDKDEQRIQIKEEMGV